MKAIDLFVCCLFYLSGVRTVKRFKLHQVILKVLNIDGDIINAEVLDTGSKGFCIGMQKIHLLSIATRPPLPTGQYYLISIDPVE